MRTFKVIIIGDTNTGKTSIIHQYTRKSFPKSHLTTPMPTEHIINSNYNCKLDIWDTAGMKEWQSTNSVIYHSVHSIILICSYDEQKSLIDLKEFWLPTLNRYLDTKSIPIFLAINKSDLPEDMQTIETNEIEQIKSEINPFKMFIVSAQNDENITELFDAVAEKLSNDHLNTPPNNNNVNINNSNKEDKKCCSWF